MVFFQTSRSKDPSPILKKNQGIDDVEGIHLLEEWEKKLKNKSKQVKKICLIL